MDITSIRCPNCGGDVNLAGSEDTIYCSYCSSLLGIDREADTPAPVLIHSTSKRSRPSARTRTFAKSTLPSIPVLFYVIAFIAPVAGFIFAAQYWNAEGENARSFAKICLVLALVNIVFEGIFIVAVVIISSLAGVN
jgi:hypothetical protein